MLHNGSPPQGAAISCTEPIQAHKQMMTTFPESENTKPWDVGTLGQLRTLKLRSNVLSGFLPAGVSPLLISNAPPPSKDRKAASLRLAKLDVSSSRRYSSRNAAEEFNSGL